MQWECDVLLSSCFTYKQEFNKILRKENIFCIGSCGSVVNCCTPMKALQQEEAIPPLPIWQEKALRSPSAVHNSEIPLP